MIKILDRYTPVQILSFGYFAVAIVGTLLLSLPIASVAMEPQSFIDAFFTATSALTTTGLIVVDTGTYYSLFGQIVIMLLFQVGGLGYMIFIVFFMFFLKERIPYPVKKILNESISRPTSLDLIKFSKVIIKLTIIIELIGVILLSLIFIAHDVPVNKAIYSGIFHSISAFCTAGFSIYSDSFTAYAGDFGMNAVLIILSLAGALGFFVLYEVFNFPQKNEFRNHFYKLSIHTKFALAITFFLIMGGTLAVFITQSSTPILEGLLTALFQTVSASSTVGFNTIDIGAMLPASLFILIILMIIGASPSGTGGGIKTTTFGVLVLTICSVLTRKHHTNIFNRSIPIETVGKALTIGLLSVLWLTFSVLILTITENLPFMDLVFEASSAFGTVGLSTGITAKLSFAGKMMISISMLFGRVGPLAIGFSLIGKEKPDRFKYSSGNVLVG